MRKVDFIKGLVVEKVPYTERPVELSMAFPENIAPVSDGGFIHCEMAVSVVTCPVSEVFKMPRRTEAQVKRDEFPEPERTYIAMTPDVERLLRAPWGAMVDNNERLNRVNDSLRDRLSLMRENVRRGDSLAARIGYLFWPSKFADDLLGE